LTRVNRRIMITALDYAFWQLFIFWRTRSTR
jgi:hypothetical protein